MLKNDIYILLRSFTKSELKILNRFLSSPYYNTNEKISRLFKEIIKFYPKFTSNKLSNENIYKRIYKKEVYNDSTMRNLFFRLEGLIREYLIVENISRDKLNKHNRLLDELNNKLLKEQFTKESVKLDIEFSKDIGTDYNYFYNRYVHEAHKFNFFNIYQKKTKKKQIDNQLHSLNNANIYLTIFFITETICSYLNDTTYKYKYKYIRNSDFISSLIELIDFEKINNLINDKFENNFILKIYVSLLRCYSDFENESNYFDYKSNVDRYTGKMSSDEVSFHYSRLINYCIRKQDFGEKRNEFKLELFKVYKVFLEKEYYKDNKTQYLPHNLFRAILFLGLSLKEFSWCKYFIDKYSTQVELQRRENMLNFGYTFFYFHTEQFEKSLEYIKKIENDYFIFKYDVNSLLVRLNFTLYDPIEIDRIIHKYIEALREDCYLPEDIRKAHTNFISYCNKLLAAMENKKGIEIGLVKKKLLTGDNIIQKEWLIKEYNLLIEKKESGKAS